MSKRVPILGSNAVLLDTRHDVLESNGIQAEIRLLGVVPSDIAFPNDVGLVVACSSLSAEARKAVIDSAHAANPRLKCLVVDAHTGRSAGYAEADEVLGALERPKRFVSLIQGMISD